ncbi:MAG TPA: type III pantothenate kinase [Gemmataceae bacterium]|jgi:type III pantothenate kinase
MTARLVADVGNTRIKWGLCLPDGLRAAAVPPDDPAAWGERLRAWRIEGPAEWAVAGVQPDWRDRLVGWLRARGAAVRVIADYRELPLRADVEAPEKVGIDRLMNAVAAVARVSPGTPVIVVGAGSAVTVDLVDEAGTFRGGSIFPGLRLMARALNRDTAQLPLVEDLTATDPPGRDTAAAIRAGVYHAVCGGIDRLVERLSAAHPGARVLLTGGDTDLAGGLRCRPEVIGPALTLDGIRRTAWPVS